MKFRQEQIEVPSRDLSSEAASELLSQREVISELERQLNLRDLAIRKEAEVASSHHEETAHLMRANAEMSQKTYSIWRDVLAMPGFEAILNTVLAKERASFLAQSDSMRSLAESRDAVMKRELALFR